MVKKLTIKFENTDPINVFQQHGVSSLIEVHSQSELSIQLSRDENPVLT